MMDRMRWFPVWIGVAVLLTGCRSEPSESPLQHPHHVAPASPSAAATTAATPQTWSMPSGSQVQSVTIDRTVAAAELGDLRYPNAQIVSAVRTHLTLRTGGEYEQTEFTLSSRDSNDTVQEWYRAHPGKNAGVRVHVHAVPTGSRIVVLRYSRS